MLSSAKCLVREACVERSLYDMTLHSFILTYILAEVQYCVWKQLCAADFIFWLAIVRKFWHTIASYSYYSPGATHPQSIPSISP